MCLGIKISCIYLRYKKLRRRNRAAPIHHKVGHFMSSNNTETIYISDLMIQNMKGEQAKQERALFFLFIHCISFLFKEAKIDNSKFDRYFFRLNSVLEIRRCLKSANRCTRQGSTLYQWVFVWSYHEIRVNKLVLKFVAP